jgi:hypothetical protein
MHVEKKEMTKVLLFLIARKRGTQSLLHSMFSEKYNEWGKNGAEKLTNTQLSEMWEEISSSDKNETLKYEVMAEHHRRRAQCLMLQIGEKKQCTICWINAVGSILLRM